MITGEQTISEIVFLIEEAPEGGYTARSLGYSIYTEADNWDELKKAIQDAVACHFEDPEHPHLIRLHYFRDEVMAV